MVFIHFQAPISLDIRWWEDEVMMIIVAEGGNIWRSMTYDIWEVDENYSGREKYIMKYDIWYTRREWELQREEEIYGDSRWLCSLLIAAAALLCKY